MTRAECLAEMTAEEREPGTRAAGGLKQSEQAGWLFSVKIGFSEQDLRWMTGMTPATWEEFLDTKLAQARISIKRYMSETGECRSPDDWIAFLKQEKAKRGE